MYRVKCNTYMGHKCLKYFSTHEELNMRQKKWLELLKDYDYDIKYHIGKTNVVIDVLSRNVILSQIIACRELQQKLMKDQIELVTKLMVGLRI